MMAQPSPKSEARSPKPDEMREAWLQHSTSSRRGQKIAAADLPRAAVLGHPTFIALAARVRRRWLLEQVRAGVFAAAGGATLLALTGRLAGWPGWAGPVALWAALALAAIVVAAFVRRPDEWAVARAADELGLEERTTSALYALGGGRLGVLRRHNWFVRGPAIRRGSPQRDATYGAPVNTPAFGPVATLVAADAARALDAFAPNTYPLVPAPRRWQLVGLAGLALLAVVLLPVPTVGPGQRRAAEAGALAAARRGVQALQAALPKTAAPIPLAQATAAELQALDQQLAQARDAAEAARALDRAQERLAGLTQPDDYAARRATEGLAAAWAGQPDLAGVAQALRSENPQAVERAVADLAARADQMTDEQRQQLQVALQAGANAARDLPDVAAALRRAAQVTANSRGDQAGQGNQNADNSQSGQNGQQDQGGQNGAAGAAIRDLSAPLAQGAARAAGAQGAQQALSGLNDVRASLGTLNGNGPLAAGTVTGTVVAGQIVPGVATGTPTALAIIPVQGSGAPGGAGAGSGSTGAGTGQSGSAGAGQGAGAGPGSAPGQPAPPDQQAGGGTNSPRDLAAPNTAAATNYDRVYAPSLMGGEGGPAVQAPGDPTGAGGDTVTLPNSPLATGAQRPYDEVYGQYESTARQSVARQALPPPLQGLVQRYFSSIDPHQPADGK